MFHRERSRLTYLLISLSGFILLAINSTYSQSYSRFQHFSSEQGLSENVVYSLLQDKKGFLWIGTWDGLNRYDGYRYKKFYHKTGDTNSVTGNTIHSLYEVPIQRVPSLQIIIIRNGIAIRWLFIINKPCSSMKR